jgi:NitT/TauT family transport system ATP-binding protein
VGRAAAGNRLLNIIARSSCRTNTVTTDGKPVRNPDATAGLFQGCAFPWLDVLGNVLFGLKLKPV